jgi:hypothetical protein
MAILGVMILGLACSFYIYAAIRWWLEVMLIRQEKSRAVSAAVHLSAKLPESMTSSGPRDTETSGIRT